MCTYSLARYILLVRPSTGFSQLHSCHKVGDFNARLFDRAIELLAIGGRYYIYMHACTYVLRTTGKRNKECAGPSRVPDEPSYPEADLVWFYGFRQANGKQYSGHESNEKLAKIRRRNTTAKDYLLHALLP